MNLKPEFEAAWKAGSHHVALLDLVHRHQEGGISATEAYRILHELWSEYGFNDEERSDDLRDNLEYVLEKI